MSTPSGSVLSRSSDQPGQPGQPGQASREGQAGAGRLLWPVANLLALLATVAVNGLANALPLNGISTGDVINRDPTPFLPANWVFSIWGLIYLMLGVFVVYGLLPRGQADPAVRAISPLFVLSCLANCTWLFLWHYGQLPLSLLVMAGLLGTLIGIYGRLSPGRHSVGLLRVPFSVYLGWVSVASIANAAVVLDRAGWDGWGIAPDTWAVVMIVAGAALATVIGLLFADPFYVAVFVWAFAGIAVRQTELPNVAGAAAWSAGALALLTVVTAFLARRRSVTPAPDSGQATTQPAESAG